MVGKLHFILLFLRVVVEAQKPCPGNSSTLFQARWNISNDFARESVLYSDLLTSRLCLFYPDSDLNQKGLKRQYLASSLVAGIQCSIPPVSTSFSSLTERCNGGKIAFVGDSLIMQYAYNFKGELDRYYSSPSVISQMQRQRQRRVEVRALKIEYLDDSKKCLTHGDNTCSFGTTPGDSHWIGRRGSPCERMCIRDPALPLAAAEGEPFWFASLNTSNVCAAVISQGAWFSLFYMKPHAGARSTSLHEEFRQSIESIRPYVKRLALGRPVVWMGLPPMMRTADVEQSDFFYRSWAHFPVYDSLAWYSLHHFVSFFNTSALLRRLKEANPAISSDGLHWCENGASTVFPTVTSRLAHMLNENLLLREGRGN